MNSSGVLFPIVALTLGVLFATRMEVSSQSMSWSLINGQIHRQFPDVRRIQTGDLAKWLVDPQKEKPVLLDVRTKAEFEVSHLNGAIRVEPGSDPGTLSIPKAKPIVTYCSVGYRSAAFAKKLGGAGYTDVANLEGSIFAWANENRPLMRRGGPADKVHPYNGFWGRLLEKPRRAEL